MDGQAIAELEKVRELTRQYRVEGVALAARRDRAIAAGIAAGLTQTKVAALLDVTRQAVAHHTSGRR